MPVHTRSETRKARRKEKIKRPVKVSIRKTRKSRR